MNSTTAKGVLHCIHQILQSIFAEHSCKCEQTRKTQPWSVVVDSLLKKVFKSNTFTSLFGVLATNGERVLFCMANPIIKESIEAYLEQYEEETAVNCDCGLKSATKATALRERGNGHFTKEEYLDAFVVYTTGLMFAPEDSDAPLLYGNRSAAFFKMHQYENALEDIERALQLGYGRLKSTNKLLIRKAECFIAMGRIAEAKHLLLHPHHPSESPAVGSLERKRWDELKRQVSQMALIPRNARPLVNLSKFQDLSAVTQFLTVNHPFRSHKEYPWLSSKVELRHDADKGHYLVATQNISFAEVIAIDKPLVGLALEETAMRQVSCHHCLAFCFKSCAFMSNADLAESVQGLPSIPARIYAPVPCTHCSSVLFCSEKCRTEAWQSYHRFECAQLPLLAKTGVQAHLALRMLYTVGDVETLKKMVEGNEASSIDIQNPSQYSHLYRMMKCPVGENKEEMRSCITACLLGKFLAKCGFIQDSAQEERLCFSTLQRHLSQLQASPAVVKQARQYEEDRIMDRFLMNPDSLSELAEAKDEYFQLASGVYSLMQPSCEGNISQSFFSQTNLMQSNVTIFVAARAIAAGTPLQVIIRTGAQPDEVSLDQRCSSPACSLCPTRERFPIGCPACRSLMVRSATEEETEDQTAAESFTCSAADCDFRMSTAQMQTLLNKVAVLVEQAKRYHSTFCNVDTTGMSRRALEQSARKQGLLVDKFTTTVRSLEPLLSGSSKFLGIIFGKLFDVCHMQTFLLVPFPSIGIRHLPTAIEYSAKMQHILEELAGGANMCSFNLGQFVGSHATLLQQFFSIGDSRIASLVKPRLLEVQKTMFSIGQPRMYEATDRLGFPSL